MMVMEKEEKKAKENKERNPSMQFKDPDSQIHVEANKDSSKLIRRMELTGICFIIS
jgi:hypothetical protein